MRGVMPEMRCILTVLTTAKGNADEAYEELLSKEFLMNMNVTSTIQDVNESKQRAWVKKNLGEKAWNDGRDKMIQTKKDNPVAFPKVDGGKITKDKAQEDPMTEVQLKAWVAAVWGLRDKTGVGATLQA